MTLIDDIRNAIVARLDIVVGGKDTSGHNFSFILPYNIQYHCDVNKNHIFMVLNGCEYKATDNRFGAMVTAICDDYTKQIAELGVVLQEPTSDNQTLSNLELFGLKPDQIRRIMDIVDET